MKKIILSIAATIFSATVFAQTPHTVSGVIKDAKGEPVIGAAVVLENNPTVGSITDINGNYTITVPDSKNTVLVYSSIGFRSIKQTVQGRAKIDITMEEDAQLLDEVVVVGYGAMRRSDLTGSVASVKIDEGDAGRSSSIDQLIQGKAAGVAITSNSGAPDGGVSIRIRGTNTFNGDVQPLFVVDGVILNSVSGTATGSTKTYGAMDEETNGLAGINPQDIASIEILKDASATAIYGSEGSNGVVLVTTKSAKSDKPTIKFSAGADVSHLYKKQDIMDFDTFVDYLVAKNGESELEKFYDDPVNRTGLKVLPMDWQDYLTRTAVSQRYYLNISRRMKDFSYVFSFGYNDKQGIVKTTDQQQFTSRLVMDKKIGKNFRMGIKMNLAYVKSSMVQGATNGGVSGGASILRAMLQYRPYTSSLDEEDESSNDEDLIGSPMRWLTDHVNINKQYRITPNIYAQYQILPWLTFKSSFGGDFKTVNKNFFKSARLNSLNTGSTASYSSSVNNSWNWDNLFLVNKVFKGGHNLSGTAGITAKKADSSAQNTQPYGIIQWRALDESGNAAPYSDFSYSESEYSTLSFLARAVYNYKDRYVLTATGRVDGSSRFMGKNKYAFFPSFAFAWRINEESWFRVPTISMAKLRLGWGQVGNQKVPSYKTIITYGAETLPSHIGGDTDKGFLRTLYADNMPNPDLKWETTNQVNAGLDFSMWRGRFAISADVYYKDTHDLLQRMNISPASGFSDMWVNNGNITNRGMEFTLSAIPVKTRWIEWSVDGNISFNRNRIESINPTQTPQPIYMNYNRENPAESVATPVRYFTGSVIGTNSLCNSSVNIFVEGQPVGLFYGYATDGIVQEGDTVAPFTGTTRLGPGHIKYLDLNNNGLIDTDDRTIIGDPNPDFTYGFSSNFAWKGFTLSVNFNGSYGNDVVNINKMAADCLNTTNQNHNVAAYRNAWTAENGGNEYPGVKQSEGNDKVYISDRYVEDASFLRLSKVAISYNIPIDKKKSKVLKGLSLSASAGNVYVWSKYSGWDPEVNSFGSNLMKMGVDFNSYPSTRNYSLDLLFTF